MDSTVLILLPENELYHPTKAGAVSRWVHEVTERLGPMGNRVHLAGRPKPADSTFPREVYAPLFLKLFLRLDQWATELRPSLHGLFYCLAFYPYLKKYPMAILQNRPDFAIWLRRLGYKGKLVLHLQNSVFNDTMGVAYRERMERYVDHVIAASHYTHEEYKGVLPGLYVRTTVITNAAHPYLFKPSSEARQPAILFAGRTIAAKGLDQLVEAFEAVRKQVPNAQLWIAGSTWFGGVSSDYERKLKTRLEPLIASGKVRWLGYLDHDNELPRVMATASVFCLPSVEVAEAMPLSVIEAMLSGTPVVSTENGGGPEALGGTGWVVPKYDTTALAGGLVQLLTDQALWQQKQQAALARAREHYTWDKVAGDFSAFLKEHC